VGNRVVNGKEGTLAKYEAKRGLDGGILGYRVDRGRKEI
jgi:hypothetical protein